VRRRRSCGGQFFRTRFPYRGVSPAPPRVTHATRPRAASVSPAASGISRLKLSPTSKRGRAQEDPAFGQIGRVQPEPSLDAVAGSANATAGAHLGGKTAACRSARAKSRTQVHHCGEAQPPRIRAWRGLRPRHAALAPHGSSETGTPPAAAAMRTSGRATTTTKSLHRRTGHRTGPRHRGGFPKRSARAGHLQHQVAPTASRRLPWPAAHGFRIKYPRRACTVRITGRPLRGGREFQGERWPPAPRDVHRPASASRPPRLS